MTALFLTVFVASLLGSLHCAGMCGAFLAIAVGGEGGMHLRTQAAYNVGRLATYVTLGAVAGFLGRLIDLAGALAGLQPIAILLAAATTISFAVVTWLQSRGVRVRLIKPPAKLLRISTAAHRVAMNRRPTTRAMVIGLATTLLPCGWLYAFAAVAAGTASPVVGAVVMVAFWFGTLPVMATLGIGVRGALGLASTRIATLSCAALVAVGLYTVAARAHLSPMSLIQTVESRSPSTSVTPAETVPSDTPACCKEADEHRH